MNLDIHKLLNLLEKQKSDRERFSIYVSKSTWLSFKKTVGERKASKTLEILMEEILAVLKSKNK